MMAETATMTAIARSRALRYVTSTAAQASLVEPLGELGRRLSAMHEKSGMT
jgi:hypothetical protein